MAVEFNASMGLDLFANVQGVGCGCGCGCEEVGWVSLPNETGITHAWPSLADNSLVPVAVVKVEIK